MKNPKYVSYLLDRSDINKNDTVIEIGPGRGIITQELVNRAERVIAIEYDKDLIKELNKTFSNNENVEIIEADFLKWNLPEYPYKVFSNIPFNMTAEIVSKLLDSINSPESTYLIMQDKAAERFIGEPIGKNSQASILLKPLYDMDIVTKISSNQFTPKPNVKILLAKFIKKELPLVSYEDRQEFRDFVIYGYNKWKPTILEAFNDVFSYKQSKIVKRKLNLEGIKPSELTIEKWIKIFEAYQEYVPEIKKEKVRGSEGRLKFKHKNMKKTYRTRVI